MYKLFMVLVVLFAIIPTSAQGNGQPVVIPPNPDVRADIANVARNHGITLIETRTRDTTPCIPPGISRHVIQAPPNFTLEEFITSGIYPGFIQELTALGINTEVNEIEVVSSNVSRASINAVDGRLRADHARSDMCQELGEIRYNRTINGFAVMANSTAGNYPYNRGMSVDFVWNPPAQVETLWGFGGWVSLLLNILTPNGFFMQSGIMARADTGNVYLVWTSSSKGLQAQYYLLDPSDPFSGPALYTSGQISPVITYYDGYWYICVYNSSINKWNCVTEFVATVGSSFMAQSNESTAVFLENTFQTLTWWQTPTVPWATPWYVSNAIQYDEHFKGAYWGGTQIDTHHSCPHYSFPSYFAMWGDLTNGNLAAFYLERSPIRCLFIPPTP